MSRFPHLVAELHRLESLGLGRAVDRGEIRESVLRVATESGQPFIDACSNDYLGFGNGLEGDYEFLGLLLDRELRSEAPYVLLCCSGVSRETLSSSVRAGLPVASAGRVPPVCGAPRSTCQALATGGANATVSASDCHSFGADTARSRPPRSRISGRARASHSFGADTARSRLTQTDAELQTPTEGEEFGTDDCLEIATAQGTLNLAAHGRASAQCFTEPQYQCPGTDGGPGLDRAEAAASVVAVSGASERIAGAPARDVGPRDVESLMVRSPSHAVPIEDEAASLARSVTASTHSLGVEQVVVGQRVAESGSLAGRGQVVWRAEGTTALVSPSDSRRPLGRGDAPDRLDVSRATSSGSLHPCAAIPAIPSPRTGESLEGTVSGETLTPRRLARTTPSIDAPKVPANQSALVDQDDHHHPPLDSPHRSPPRLPGHLRHPALLMTGSGSSRLVHGSRQPHARLERAIAAWLQEPAALLFSSGYAANVGVMSAIGLPADVIFSDSLNHASLIDGCRLSRATTVVYSHLDLEQLEAHLLAQPCEGHRWIVTESYFSMDGDSPDLLALAALAHRFDASLIVDEAHALGIYGPQGRGLAAAVAVRPDVTIGTLGKAFGTHGAFVASDTTFIAWLWARARSFVYSTAPSPVVSTLSVRHLHAVILADDLRMRLHTTVEKVRRAFTTANLPIHPQSHGPIVPILLNDNQRALAAANYLQTQGILAQSIRPPTVPANSARLRLTLRADLSDEQLERLVDQVIRACRLQ